jgi:hypothetical protein
MASGGGDTGRHQSSSDTEDLVNEAVEYFSGPLNLPSLMSLARKDGTICSDSTLYNHLTVFKY